MMHKYLLFCSVLLLLSACGGGGGDSSGTTTDNYAITLDFQRVSGSSTPNPFTVTATITDNGQPLTGITTTDVQVTLTRGSYNAVSAVGNGQYQFTVTPDQTGEYPVTVTYKGISLTRTALAVDSVLDGWGQPMSVAGYVNTAGYEDGVTISPDGNYLFVQYSPIYFSALQLFYAPRASGGCEGNRLEYPIGTPNRCTHQWLDSTIGPYTAPERPGFFDGRISNGTLLHNATSWGVGIDQAPNFAPSTMFYGFKRQADGSFKEPFYLAFDDENDGIINPSGLTMRMNGNGTATIAFAMLDPSQPYTVNLDGINTEDSKHDIYTMDITLGQNTILGTFVATGTAGTPPVRSTPFPAQLVNFGMTGTDGIAGTQGNPHLYYDSNNTIQSVWTDDEYDDSTDPDRGNIAVYQLTSGSFPDGTWSKILLPDVINKAMPSSEIQPFFTGTGLFYTHSSDTESPEIYYASYSGTQTNTDYANAANWGTPEKILGVGAADAEGKIIAIGEPTIANYQGSEYLYFVYGYIRGYDSMSGLPDINMQAGYIKKN